ncbi:MAG: hypothetical protein CL859_07310 [Cyanobium sp. ARS6]|nr:hypothetical protein [Cyanobium sp. ARS6]|tara:strand:- start:8822 stop:9664 length:843 start_codon:yes stop_codon:yes gene_type:complete
MRTCYEKVHENVSARLSPSEETMYCSALFDFFAHPPEDAREAAIEYLRAASEWLTDDERMSLTPVPVEYITLSCPHCGARDWVLDEARGDRVCERCGLSEASSQVHKKFLPFDRPPPRVSNMYRRSTHFAFMLNSLVTHRPPPEMLALIEAELVRQRCKVAYLTLNRLCQIMRTVGLKNHYALSPSILSTLKGEALPHLSINDIDRLYRLFERVQRAFDEVIASVDVNRHNFVSYPFLLRQCLQMIGRADLAQHLPHLKTPEKRRQQCLIWDAVLKKLAL